MQSMFTGQLFICLFVFVVVVICSIFLRFKKLGIELIKLNLFRCLTSIIESDTHTDTNTQQSQRTFSKANACTTHCFCWFLWSVSKFLKHKDDCRRCLGHSNIMTLYCWGATTNGAINLANLVRTNHFQFWLCFVFFDIFIGELGLGGIEEEHVNLQCLWISNRMKWLCNANTVAKMIFEMEKLCLQRFGCIVAPYHCYAHTNYILFFQFRLLSGSYTTWIGLAIGIKYWIHIMRFSSHTISRYGWGCDDFDGLICNDQHILLCIFL